MPLLLVGLPSLAYLFDSGKKRPDSQSWRNLGKLEQFPIGKMQEVHLEIKDESWRQTLSPKSVYVWRQTESEFIIFSRSCTDLGCPITWDPGSQWFFCPCHGGIFAKDGEPKAGPPKKPLYRYASRIRNGILQIDTHAVPPMI